MSTKNYSTYVDSSGGTCRFEYRKINNFFNIFFSVIINLMSLKIGILNIHYFWNYKLFLDLENLSLSWVIINTKWPLHLLHSNAVSLIMSADTDIFRLLFFLFIPK